MFDASRSRMLEAMGYQLLRRVRGAASGRGNAAGRDAAPAAVEAAVMPRRPSAAGSISPTHDRAVIRPPSASVVSDDALWQALLVAAALDPATAEANGLRLSASGTAVEYVRDELWIDPRALRRDPRAKARLWKALRTLRRRASAARR